MVFQNLNEWRLAFAEFMNTGIIKNSLIYIDLWSFVHIFTGFLMVYLMQKYNIFKYSKLKQFLMVIFVESLWEVYEWIFYSRGLFFGVDTTSGIVWDIIMDALGALIYFAIF